MKATKLIALTSISLLTFFSCELSTLPDTGGTEPAQSVQQTQPTQNKPIDTGAGLLRQKACGSQIPADVVEFYEGRYDILTKDDFIALIADDYDLYDWRSPVLTFTLADFCSLSGVDPSTVTAATFYFAVRASANGMVEYHFMDGGLVHVLIFTDVYFDGAEYIGHYDSARLKFLKSIKPYTDAL